jgi:transitional endoplasmic reticulum ATPase
VNLNKLALKTENLTGSDIEFICRKAAMLAIRELIDKTKGKSIENTVEIKVKEAHFETAIQLVLKQNATKK